MHVQDPAYDGGRTIQIPEASKSKLSGSQKQYWEVKANYLDVVCFQLLHGRVSAQLVCAWLQQNASESVLRSDSGVQMIFFMVGKFYELYEEDAAIAYEVLGYKVTVSGVGRCRCVHALCQDCRCFGCRGSASILSNYLLLGSFSKFPAVHAGRRTRERLADGYGSSCCGRCVYVSPLLFRSAGSGVWCLMCIAGCPVGTATDLFPPALHECTSSQCPTSCWLVMQATRWE